MIRRVLPALVIVAVLAAAGVCVRLGLWQLRRWEERRALNAALREPPGAAAALPLAGEPPPFEAVRGRTLEVEGEYDESRQVLLVNRLHLGTPGVEVVTPLRPPSAATAVLVDRGWLPAEDGVHAATADYREPGPRRVRGRAEPLRRGAGGPPVRTLREDSVVVYSARWLDADSLAGRFPYPLASFVVRQLPEPGQPPYPLRRPPATHDESMHLGYAFQWFLFAAILLGGGAALAWSRRRPAPSPEDPA